MSTSPQAPTPPPDDEDENEVPARDGRPERGHALPADSPATGVIEPDDPDPPEPSEPG